MKKNYWIGILFFLFFSIGINVNAQFTQGRLVALQVGDGTAALSSSATPVFLKEFTNTGTAGITVNVPTTGTNRLTISGSAGSDGQMTLSQDGKFISIAGYDAASGTATITGTTSSVANRVINTVDATGNVIRGVSTSTQFSANNFRSAVKGNNADYWGAGGNSGTYYFGTTATAGAIQTTTANTRVVNIFNGNLYYSTGSGTLGIYGFSGTPTATSTPSLLIATGTGSSPYSFAINSSGTIAYIADDRASASAGGVQKWTFNGSVWTLSYNLSSGATIGARGLAVDFSGTNPVIFAATTDNKIIKYTDTGVSSTASTLYTAPTNTAIRGLTFAPSNPVIPPSITTSEILNSVNTIYGTASATPTSFTVSGSNLTNNILITPPTGYEISKTFSGTSGYASTQTLTQTSGSVASTIIYVRLKANATVVGSPYSGNVVLSSTGATSVNVPTVSSTVSPKALTITGLTADNKIYDATTTASFSGTPAYNGLENGETFSVSGTTTASFATASVANAKPVSISGYTAPSTNYTLLQPTLSANITPAILTISSAATSNKIYDGNNSATIIGTLLGVIGSETVTLNLSGIFSLTGVGTALPVTSTSTITGVDAGNYSLTQPIGLTADITAKALTITGLSAKNKVFDGTTTATLLGTAALNGVISGEENNVTLTGSPTATFAQSAAGNGIAVTVTGYSLTGSGSGNYTVSQPTGLTADITAAPSPTITSILTASATYGVASTSYFITATNSPMSFNATGLPTGLTINTSTGEISGMPTDVAGTPFSVTLSATNLGGTGTATLVYTINPKALTITSPSVPNKVYDRTNAATITGTLSGVLGTDDVTLNGTGTFSQVNVGTGLAVTSTSTLSGADASKYSLTQPSGLTGEIVLKPLTISGASVTSKVYDGNSTLTLVGATLNGILSPDVVTLTGGAVFSSVNVGNNIDINTSSLILGGAEADNYFALPIVGLTGNITAKPLTITGLTANNKVFDGTTTATLSGTAALNGVIGTDNVSISGTATATFNNRNIGTVKPITIAGYSLTGLQSGNYSVSQPTGLTANITPLSLTVNSPIAQNKVFDGNTTATITGTLTGIISPDVVTFVGTGTFASSAVGTGIAVTSTSTLGGAGAGNYTLTQPTGLLANITAPQFSTGNLVVVNVNSTNSVSLIEYSNSGTLQQTLSIPSTGTDALTISYTAGSEGALSRSSSGYYLGLVGYRTGTNSSATDRVIARVNSTGTINTKSVIPNAEGYTANNIRAAVFNDDGSRFWTSGTGTAAGVRTNVFEATSGSTQVSTTLTNTRAINIFNNQLYISSASGTFQGLSTVGTGLPTTTGNTIALLPGFPTTTGPGSYGFAINSTNTIAYVADDRATVLGGIQKWTFNGNTWSLAYTLGTGVANNGARGLAVDWSGANPIIYATTAEAALNRIIKIIDSGASSTASTLATSVANNIFRGLAFSPILAPTSVSLSVSSNTGTESAATVITVTATASSPVVGNQTVSLGVTGTNITAGDFTLSSSTITIPNGSTTGSVTFTIVDDIIAEATETAILTISSPSSGIILGSPITQNITITDNDNTAPTVVMDVATTSNYVDGGIATSPAGSFATSGVLNDPTDPAKNFGIDFTIGDTETVVGSLIVSATSSNVTVLPFANLNLTGTGASRNLKITPNAEGFSDVTVTVNDGTTTSSFTINYASSNASINTSTTRFHTGTSDASTAQMIDNNFMIVGDDENQALRLYDRQNSGLPIKSFDFTTSLGLSDISAGLPREVDIEASAKVGNRIYWMGSHSNASSGNNRPNRSRFFATDITGTGNATTLSYIGRYENLKSDLFAWDAANGHGLGTNFLGLAASAMAGIAPEIADGSGFNIEGFEIAPNNTTAYICFRAPLQTTITRTKALIIPLTNFANLVSGNPTTTTATFGNPIQLDLGGRAIREMKKNATGEYLIIAGPNDGATGVAPKDFRFYTWTGNPTDAPILRSANLTAFNSGGSFESIVDLPSPLLATSNLQVLVDNGDAVFYGNGTIAKELPQNNHKKFRSETINLGTEILPLITIKSITTGNWESTSTWDLGRVPQAGDLVIIDQNHEVTLNGTGIAKKIEYQGTGKLIFSSNASILNTGL
jgi:hypothetical protein